MGAVTYGDGNGVTGLVHIVGAFGYATFGYMGHFHNGTPVRKICLLEAWEKFGDSDVMDDYYQLS